MSKLRRLLNGVQPFIPLIARLLLTASFIDDCWRVVFGYKERFAHTTGIYRMPAAVAHAFLITMFLLESSGCVLVVARKRMGVACACFAIVLSTHFVMMMWRFFFYKTLFRMFAQFGSVFLLYADAQSDMCQSGRYGVPSASLSATILTDEHARRKRAWLTFAGRLLIVCMCVNVITVESSLKAFVWNGTALGSALFIVIGCKTRIAAVVMCMSLAVFNFTQHGFWMLSEDTPIWMSDVVRRSFFLVLNAIGGLLTLTQLGAGAFSIDERKKRS